MLRYKHQEKSFSLQKDHWLQCENAKIRVNNYNGCAVHASTK